MAAGHICWALIMQPPSLSQLRVQTFPLAPRQEHSSLRFRPSFMSILFLPKCRFLCLLLRPSSSGCNEIKSSSSFPFKCFRLLRRWTLYAANRSHAVSLLAWVKVSAFVALHGQLKVELALMSLSVLPESTALGVLFSFPNELAASKLAAHLEIVIWPLFILPSSSIWEIIYTVSWN